jgi:hypothetical protein
MFYCEKCRNKWKWPKSMARSLGRCEMCGSASACWDRPASTLPDPIGVLTEEEVLRAETEPF